MSNLSKSASKFLKNKNTVTVLGVIICFIVLIIGYNVRINQKTELVKVYYANQTIQPKTKITDDMISSANVPTSFLVGSYYTNYNDIVGKYSNYNTVIASGSLFYNELLIEEENLPDSVFYNVPEGEVVVSFPVNTVSTYGNSIMPNNLINVYVKMIDDSGKIIYGRFIDNINVLAVKDSSGKNVFESTEEERTPAFIYFSLVEPKYLLFSSMNYIETNDIEVIIVPNTIKYTPEDKTAVEVTSDYITNFIIDKIKMIDDQKDLYNELLNEMATQTKDNTNNE
ncbi:flp pilus assembly protein CpaB [Clostridium sp. CAG:914]|jgi:hypothetical protein|nr:flp pilus assembly protein CpaB [Clostridium sp. CAG:914]